MKSLASVMRIVTWLVEIGKKYPWLIPVNRPGDLSPKISELRRQVVCTDNSFGRPSLKRR